MMQHFLMEVAKFGLIFGKDFFLVNLFYSEHLRTPLNLNIKKFGNISVSLASAENAHFTKYQSTTENALTPTRIEDVKVVGPMSNGYIYNLSGQRQSKTQRGINIVNGQKILK